MKNLTKLIPEKVTDFLITTGVVAGTLLAVYGVNALVNYRGPKTEDNGTQYVSRPNWFAGNTRLSADDETAILEKQNTFLGLIPTTKVFYHQQGPEFFKYWHGIKNSPKDIQEAQEKILKAKQKYFPNN